MIKLVCIVPLHGHVKGQEVTDEEAVKRLWKSHSHHFVRVEAPEVVAIHEPEKAAAPAEKPTK